MILSKRTILFLCGLLLCGGAFAQTVSVSSNAYVHALVRLVPGTDSDGDGLSDLAEIQFGTSSQLADSDGDGLNDLDEIRLHKTDPLLADMDGDGMSDGDEIFAGTNPADAASVIRMDPILWTENGPKLSWSTVYGRGYLLQWTDTLSRPWSNLFNNSVYEYNEYPEGHESVWDLFNTNRAGFYRIIIQPDD